MVRLPLTQRARDRAASLDSGGFISGYRDSPLGGYDRALWRADSLLREDHIHFQPGLNEDLAATSVWGTQQLHLFPGAKVAGVFAIWYGKGPGVDRSTDVFKQGNCAGSARHGGVLLVAGDDHGCQSSTLPHQSEQVFAAAMIPVLNPATVQDYLDFGLYGIALSRYSGCWTGFKAIAETVESSASVDVGTDRLVRLPEGISFEQAAAMMVKGLTVQFLIRRTFPVRAGQAVLLHAAAGGVGLIACQWLRALGARVIGTVGSAAKAELACAHGCEHTIVLGEQDFVARVREITGGEGVSVVYDSIGNDTFLRSLDCLARFGMMVSFGNASGKAPAIKPALLAAKGSLFLTRPSLDAYAATRADLEAGAAELFDAVLSGRVGIDIHQRYALRDAPRAQTDLATRKTTGSSVLLP